ncbi:MAG: 5-formyltetrahydrofolate cyclo-ligase [Alphaproteobacteria bacterium]
MRAESIARRRAIPASAKAEAARRVELTFEGAIAPLAGEVVSGYWPEPDELDVRPLLVALHARGHAVALPVVGGRGQPLMFRRWRPDDSLVAGALGIATPSPEAPELRPTILLVPLLAFDRDGYRLGRGGGYYDRTLRAARAAGRVLAVGVAFAAQEVARVPRDDGDERLDWIVTEGGAVRFEPSSARLGSP